MGVLRHSVVKVKFCKSLVQLKLIGTADGKS